MEHEETMIDEMKNDIKRMIKRKMSFGWSQNQIIGMYLVAEKRAIEELAEEE